MTPTKFFPFFFAACAVTAKIHIDIQYDSTYKFRVKTIAPGEIVY